MQHLLAAGIGPLVWIVGRLVLSAAHARGRRRPLLIEASFTFGVGLCAMTPLLLLAAAAGRFDAASIGGAGWLASFASLALSRKRSASQAHTGGKTFDRYDAAAVAIAVAFAVFAFLHREPTLGYGRDQQVYAEYAISLSRYGNAAPILHASDEADRALIRVVTQSRAMFFMPGILPERPSPQAPIRSYLPLGWTVWLAFAHAVGGMPLLYGANALVMGFAVTLVFALARALAGPAIALGASIAFASLPLSFWVARLTLSEPLSLCLLLMLPLAPLAIRHDRSLALISLVLFGACLVRADAVVAAPALILALLPDVERIAPGQWARARNAIAAIALTASAVCVIHAALNPAYFADVARFLRPALAVTWLLALAAVLPRRQLAQALGFTHATATWIVAVVAIVLLFAYSALLRPSIEPYSLIPFAGGLTGTRDFREASLVNLAAYTGWPLLLLSLAGACIALRAALRRSSSSLLRILVALSLGFALLYLWFPHVSPDHPWAARRFVPVILPAIPLFGAIALRTVLNGRRIWLRVGAFLLAFASVPAWAVQRDALLRVRDDQSIPNVEAIANRLPDSLVVADGRLENIATALFVAYRKPLVVLHLNADVDVRLASRWIEAKARAGNAAWVLEDPAAPRAGAIAHDVAHWTIERTAIERSNVAPARVLTTEVTPVALTRFDRIDPDRGVAHTMFGADRVWGVAESGFYRAEIAPYGAFRYTDGGAWMLFPAKAWRNAIAVKLDLFSFGDTGRRQWVRLAINGRTIWNGSVAAGVSSIRAPLPAGVLDRADDALIELWSETRPIAWSAVEDHAPLGVGLIGLRPLDRDDEFRASAHSQTFAGRVDVLSPVSRFVVQAAKPPSVDVEIENTGSAPWPTIRELAHVRGVVRIASRWYHADDSSSMVGNNWWDMAISLLPGDTTRVRVPLSPVALNGERLPPGRYEIRIGLFREGFDWIAADAGRIPVVIE
jgi:hypothetical protein